MATITPTDVTDGSGLFRTVTWADIATGDVGAAVGTFVWEQQYVQNSNGENVIIEASNDGTVWSTVFVAPSTTVTEITTRPRYIRPHRVSIGPSSTITLFCSAVFRP